MGFAFKMLRQFFAFGCGASAAAIALRTNCWMWLAGRTNCRVPGFWATIACGICWAALILSFLIQSIRRRSELKGVIRFYILTIVAVNVLPLIIIRGSEFSAFTQFQNGFAAWASKNVDCEAAVRWGGGVRRSTEDNKPVPPWWPTRERDVSIGESVPGAGYPPFISKLWVDDLRITENPTTVLLAWEGHHTEYIRFTVCGFGAESLLPQFGGSVVWRRVRPDLLVGVCYRE